MATPPDPTLETPAPALPPVTLTPKAIEMVKLTRDQEGIDASFGLRVAVMGGGCSGFQYALDFEPEALSTWWETSRSLCVPKPLGSYAAEWAPTERRDELLGRLGGTLHGTVMEFVPGREFFVAELYWLPPDGDPIGPMALTAACAIEGTATRLRICQSGYDDRSRRWARYYDLLEAGWGPALNELKGYLETRR